MGVIIKASGGQEDDGRNAGKPTGQEQKRPIGKVIPPRRSHDGTDDRPPPVTHHKGGIRRTRR